MASQMPIGKELAASWQNSHCRERSPIFSNVIVADVFLGLILSLLIVPSPCDTKEMKQHNRPSSIWIFQL